MSGITIPDPVISIGIVYGSEESRFDFSACAAIYVGGIEVYRTEGQELLRGPDEHERVERELREQAEAMLAAVMTRLLAEEANDGAT